MIYNDAHIHISSSRSMEPSGFESVRDFLQDSDSKKYIENSIVMINPIIKDR